MSHKSQYYYPIWSADELVPIKIISLFYFLVIDEFSLQSSFSFGEGGDFLL